ncbi:MAG: tRNA pseudouridine(38-40) synthase TruA [Kiritimatiellaeota bacterium]|nr:tRNA pseudouridine(38-40) synthase TruA [Kiritimatiellota bacterium]
MALGPQAPVPTWRLALAYDGTDYHGWQVQPNARTVEGELLRRLRALTGKPDLRTEATSRTDAGVHALDQQVSFTARLPGGMSADRLRFVLNRWLPPDIRVMAAALAPPGFSARFSAWGKAYTYVVHTGGTVGPFQHRYAWHRPGEVDLDAMRSAAGALLGEHDFASFTTNPKREIESTVRHVLSITVHRVGDWLFVCVEGRSFLYRMVRTLVGYLLAVGAGRCRADEAAARLAEKDRRGLGADTAPPHGLFLARVFFEARQHVDYRPALPPFHAFAGDPFDRGIGCEGGTVDAEAMP